MRCVWLLSFLVYSNSYLHRRARVRCFLERDGGLSSSPFLRNCGFNATFSSFGVERQNSYLLRSLSLTPITLPSTSTYPLRMLFNFRQFSDSCLPLPVRRCQTQAATSAPHPAEEERKFARGTTRRRINFEF